MESFIGNYFQSAYLHPNEPSVDHIMHHLDSLDLPKISISEGQSLDRPFSNEEILEAVNQLKSFKASGPDGIPAEFFHKFWDTIKDDICVLIKDFQHVSFLLKEFNNTYISLIPKCQNPEVVSHFRPIGLCNTIYKIIAKILVNRLQPLIGNWIAPNQNGFLKGLQIADNILLASELMQYIHKAKKAKTFWCALKLDMSKAYDKLGWNFLRAVMQKMNFP